MVDVIRILLVSGADQDVRDHEGRTPFECAEKWDEYTAREAFLELDAEMIEVVAADLLQNYTFASGRRWTADESLEAKCSLPSFLFEEQQRTPSLPRSLAVHEHHILPLIQEGDSRRGVDALHCLSFAKDQAELNRARRERLLKAYDSSWDPPSRKQQQAEEGKHGLGAVRDAARKQKRRPTTTQKRR
jgi:hypothetical protein